MDYPDSIGPYVYRRGFEIKCEHELKRKGVGAFAFYEVEQPKTTRRGEQKTFEWAINRTRGDYYRANKLLDKAQSVGIALMLNGGIIEHQKLSCRKIKQIAKTYDEFIKDMLKNGWPIDPKKLCDEAEMYRPAVY